MKNLILLSALFFSLNVLGQDATGVSSESLFYNLSGGDSVTFYQCHVEQGIQQLTTASGQTITGNSQQFSITEKYVLKKTNDGYTVSYYTTSLNVMPNKKFSGLKIKERPYWEFKNQKSFLLLDTDLKVFLALEKKGREANEFDFGITKYTTNQIIIKREKDFKQLVIDGNYVVSKLITM